MNNSHLALIFIRRSSDFFREPLDQPSIFFRRQHGQLGFRKSPARKPLDDGQMQKQGLRALTARGDASFTPLLALSLNGIARDPGDKA
jgi:hypothetical protein